MEYALIPLFRQGDDRISLTPEEYAQLSHAKKALVGTIGIEQKFDLLLENYVEYESELLNLGLRLLAFRDSSQWHAFQEESLGVTRRLVNLLSAARLYVDQMRHDLSRLFGKDHEVCAAVKQTSAEQYDANFGFRLMETLRNAVQHRSIAGIRLKHHFGTRQSDAKSSDPIAAAATRHVIARAIPILSVSDLHDMELKATVRAEIENLGQKDLELTLYVREYIDGLAAMQYEFRRRAEPQRKEWEAVIRQALARARDTWPESTSDALDLAALDASGEIAEWTHLFPAFIDYLAALERKNAGPLRLSRMYVSGQCDID
jgi:hypothetical protein